MASPLLTTASTLQCPHGGKVSIVSTNTQAQGAAALALATDVFTISGCPWQVTVGPSLVPHPCVRVQWTRTNTQTTVNGVPTLSQDSTGACLAADQVAQGSVVVVQTQPLISGA